MVGPCGVGNVWYCCLMDLPRPSRYPLIFFNLRFNILDFRFSHRFSKKKRYVAWFCWLMNLARPGRNPLIFFVYF